MPRRKITHRFFEQRAHFSPLLFRFEQLLLDKPTFDHEVIVITAYLLPWR
jgi:hypothetical protein